MKSLHSKPTVVSY